MINSRRCLALSSLLALSFLLAWPLVRSANAEATTNSNSPVNLGLCQGECDQDAHCEEGLYCFHRDVSEPIPGCEGGDNDPIRTGYCVPKNATSGSPTFLPASSPQALPTSLHPTISRDNTWRSGGSEPPSTAPQVVSTPLTTESPSSSPQSTPTAFTPPETALPTKETKPGSTPIATTTNPSLPALVSYGGSPPDFRFPLGLCEGDCDSDSHCQAGLVCFQRSENDPVPGCAGSDSSRTDYCTYPGMLPVASIPTLNPTKTFKAEFPTTVPTAESDMPSTVPSVQSDMPSTVPTSESDMPSTEPTQESAIPSAPPSQESDMPSAAPTQESDMPASVPTQESDMPSTVPTQAEPTPSIPILVSYSGSPPLFRFPLGLCEGDCDNDSQCQAGLICFQRTGPIPVPGCRGSDSSLTDYCVDPDNIPVVNKFSAGKLTVQKLGLLLSEGLDARLIGTTGEKVTYANGGESNEAFHAKPDAGATFPDVRKGNKGGWIYVSNSEVPGGQGGVGAITFDKHGNITEYRVLLSNTSMNCGGGRTPWNTWVSCEEHGTRGQVHQVDPTGQKAPEILTVGSEGGNFESFAYDIRDLAHPHYFVTEDHREGALRRFTPYDPNWDEPWSMLHGQGEVHYLVLFPQGDGSNGTYEWTENKMRAKSNADSYYRNSEGIDVKGSSLYFVCKEEKHLFILDLDKGTYQRQSTVSGLFDGAPDQVERVMEGSSKLLYFTEEGGKDAGVHARDQDGRFFTILESPVYNDETTGLSWSPDGRFMYIAYQFNGLLFAVWRRDGAPFHESQLDVKSHEVKP
eukprot:scaffold1184_cov132-Cylindrotheca_fusiformis.AAC.100